MSAKIAMLFPKKYIQGSGILAEEIAKAAEIFGKKAFLLCDHFIYARRLPEFSMLLNKTVNIKAAQFDAECCDEEIQKQETAVERCQADVIIGIGGGKTLDTAKAVAGNLNLPLIAVPTIAATGACTAVSDIYSKQGVFRRYQPLSSKPETIVVDTAIIAQAPERLLAASMGSALASWFEASSCMKSGTPGAGNGMCTLAAYNFSWYCYETLLEYGTAALQACRENRVTPALEHIVEAVILLSGICFDTCGQAAPHAIYNGLTELQETRKSLYGENLAFSTLVSLFLTDRPQDMRNDVFSFCESVGLPTRLIDIGIVDARIEKIMKVTKRACEPNGSMHNEAITVTPHMVEMSILEADRQAHRRSTQSKHLIMV